MRHVLVRSLPDRVAYTAPRGGQLIPSDRDVLVPFTEWINQLANSHGDIIVTEIPDEAPATAPVEKPAKAASPKSPKSPDEAAVKASTKKGDSD